MKSCQYPYGNPETNCSETFFEANHVSVMLITMPLLLIFLILTAFYMFLCTRISFKFMRIRPITAPVALNLISCVFNVIVVFNGIGTKAGLDSGAGRLTYLLFCLGFNCAALASIITNGLIARRILPQEYTPRIMKKLTILTYTTLVIEMSLWIALIFTQDINNYFRVLIPTAMVTVVICVLQATSTFGAIVNFSVAANRQSKTIDSNMEWQNAYELDFIIRQLIQVKKFENKNLVVAAGILLMFVIIYSVPGLMENHVVLFLVCYGTILVNAVLLGIYFPLNRHEIKRAAVEERFLREAFVLVN